ncbi:hypothetical protein BGW39_008716 [Mortierella sp. 14UC]|nr:hypothetical protein BGW39_008716 [Mortierella sp. 14UC]
MSTHQDRLSRNTIPRPANFNYPELIDSVNRIMNYNSYNKQENSRQIQMVPSRLNSFVGGLNLTDEELRRINGHIPPTTHENMNEVNAILANMRLHPPRPAASSSRSKRQQQYLQYLQNQQQQTRPSPVPPRVQPQGPRPKPPLGTVTAAAAAAAEPVARHVCANDYEGSSSKPVDMNSLLPPPPPNSSWKYIRSEKDLQVVNHSLESWMLQPCKS